MRKVAVCLTPVMPQAASVMLEQLGCREKPDLAAEATAFGLLPRGVPVALSSTLFPRLDMPVADETPKEQAAAKPAAKGDEKKAAKPQAAKAPDSAAPETPGIAEFADFQKLDLRVGEVVEAVRHPDADRLLLVRVDLGEGEPRQVVAGLAEFFTPEDLVGRRVVVVANLAPRKLRGQESQGMILAVRTEGGMELLTSSGGVPSGSKVS